MFNCIRSKGETEKKKTLKALLQQLSEDLDKKLKEVKLIGKRFNKSVEPFINYLDGILEENDTEMESLRKIILGWNPLEKTTEV